MKTWLCLSCLFPNHITKIMTTSWYLWKLTNCNLRCHINLSRFCGSDAHTLKIKHLLKLATLDTVFSMKYEQFSLIIFVTSSGVGNRSDSFIHVHQMFLHWYKSQTVSIFIRVSHRLEYSHSMRTFRARYLDLILVFGQFVCSYWHIDTHTHRHIYTNTHTQKIHI